LFTIAYINKMKQQVTSMLVLFPRYAPCINSLLICTVLGVANCNPNTNPNPKPNPKVKLNPKPDPIVSISAL